MVCAENRHAPSHLSPHPPSRRDYPSYRREKDGRKRLPCSGHSIPTAWLTQGEAEMENTATYRVLMFDDDDSIRQVLWHYFDSRGYEVFTFPHPATCPLDRVPFCQCPLGESC